MKHSHCPYGSCCGGYEGSQERLSHPRARARENFVGVSGTGLAHLADWVESSGPQSFNQRRRRLYKYWLDRAIAFININYAHLVEIEVEAECEGLRQMRTETDSTGGRRPRPSARL